MGRLWRGMGGMGHPEPLSAHRPRRQHGLGFSRITRHEMSAISPWVRKGSHNQNGRLDHCPRRQVTVFQFVHCSPLFAIVRYCSTLFTKKIVLYQCPRANRTAAHAEPRSLLRWARSRGKVRLSRGMCGGGGEWGQASLYFSRRGKAECTRGPSGRVTSFFSRVGALDSTLSTASKRNEVLAVVWRASAVMWVESGGGAPAVGRGSSSCWRLSPLASASVSPLATFPLPRSSNRTCGFPASGFPMGSCLLPHVAWSGFPEPLPTLLDVCQWSCPASVPSCPHRKAPSLARHYPASPVLRASPPPCRPDLSLAAVR